MEPVAEQHALENEQKAIEQYLEHPISRKIFADNAEQQEQLVTVICDIPIHDIESFFKHFEAVGHLRGLRRGKGLVLDDLETIKNQLKELQ
jgi:hypothetical protein